MGEGEKDQITADTGIGGDALTESEAAEAAETPDVDALAAAGIGLRWQDRLMLKMMSNKIVIKIFSNPIVMKVITWEMKAFIAISSLFRRKSSEGQ